MYLNKKYKKNSGRSNPYVNFNNCNDLELKLIDWIGDDKLINESVGFLVLRLHILHEEENLIEFCKYNKDNNSFKCIINNKDVYDIRINNLNDKDKNKEIVVDDGNIEWTYLCEPVSNMELGMRITLSSYKKDCLYGLVKLTHYLSRDYTMFDIDYMDYFLRLRVVKPDSVKLPIFDNNGRYSRYKLDNEEGLISYLINLMPPFSLEYIYKELCEISLGDNIDNYPDIYLEMAKNNKYRDKKITDLIHLRYGKLERFGITKIDSNKSLFLNGDESWEYHFLCDESLVNFSMNVNGNNINYNICVKQNSDMSLVLDIIKDNMNDASSEIEEVKVLSRKLLN